MELKLPDLGDGTLAFQPSNNKLGPYTLEDEFLQSSEGRRSKPFVTTPGHHSFKLGETWLVRGRSLGAIAWFTSGKLASVTLFLLPDVQGWSGWSEQQALDERDQLEQLLTENYGDVRAFSWGGASASYDPRSGSSSIVVRYHRSGSDVEP